VPFLLRGGRQAREAKRKWIVVTAKAAAGLILKEFLRVLQG